MPLEPSVRQHGCDVLIFDSGVGGISILKAIHDCWPQQYRLAYASDNEAFPYGTKDEDWLRHRVATVMDRLVVRIRPRLIVVACNTASTIVLPMLRAQYEIPIVGVIPAIKPAAEQSKSRVIALLATPGTVQRSYTQQLIDNFARDCRVIRVGSSRLVEIAEEKLMGLPVVSAELEEICRPILDGAEVLALDQLVLGCTHFPLLASELQALLPSRVALVDSGQAIAYRVAQLLPPDTGLGYEAPLAFVTKPAPDRHPLRVGLRCYGFQAVETLSVDV